MSRCPLSISPSMPVLPFPDHALVPAELLLQPRNIHHVPVLGKLAVLDAPDIDRAPAHALAGWRKAQHGLRVRSGERRAHDDLVGTEDAVLEARLEIRPVLEYPL